MNEPDKASEERYEYRVEPMPGGQFEAWLTCSADKVYGFHEAKYSFGGGKGGFGEWVRCQHPNCLGEAVLSGKCFSHLEGAQQTDYLLMRRSKRLSFRGNTLGQGAWDRIVEAAITSTVPAEHIDLGWATIDAKVQISRWSVQSLSLLRATFKRVAQFEECEFRHLTAMGVISDHLSFHRCTFNGDLHLSFSKGCLDFKGSTFHGRVGALGVLGPSLGFSGCTVLNELQCPHVQGIILLDRAKLHAGLNLQGAELSQLTLDFLSAHSPLRITAFRSESISLRNATFLARLHVEATCKTLSMEAAVLKDGGLVSLSGEYIQLSRMSSGAALKITSPSDLPTLQVGSITNADLSKVSFTNLNLSRCIFHGAHGLSEVNIDSTNQFPRRGVSGRRYIRDELAWRATAGPFHMRGWDFSGINLLGSLAEYVKVHGLKGPIAQLPKLSAVQVAATYRDLRRSLESKSDMSGAADFYYGEMEMRRWSAPYPERALIAAYWLLSGYGLQASRALMAWLLLVGLGTIVMMLAGFQPQVGGGNVSMPVPAAMGQTAHLSGAASTAVAPIAAAAAVSASNAATAVLNASAPLRVGVIWTANAASIASPTTGTSAVVSAAGSSSHVIAGVALPTTTGGASQRGSFERALLFSMRATVPGVSTVEGKEMTLIGQWIELGLRIFGPLTIALFAVAIRTRLVRKPAD